MGPHSGPQSICSDVSHFYWLNQMMQPNLASGDHGETVSPLNNEPPSLLVNVTWFGNALNVSVLS